MTTDERPSDFGRTVVRLLGAMGPDRRRMAVVVTLALAIAVFTSVIPRLLGRATDVVLDGVAGSGVDTAAFGRILGLTAACAVGAALFTMIQGRVIAAIVQRMTYRLREGVDVKLSRLPLRYFDSHSRGEVLSRATNDLDNLQQTLQLMLNRQVVSMMLVLAVPVMMFTVSPLLTGVIMVTVPVTLGTAALIGRRAQPEFAKQWAATGAVNGHVEEMYTGHALVTAFGRADEVTDTFEGHNDELFRSGTRAQFLSGLIQPALTFLGNLNYVLVAVIGGLRVAAGALTIGDIQAFIQYVLQFNQPITGMAAMSSQFQSAVASAERVFELLDTDEEEPDSASAPDSAPAPDSSLPEPVASLPEAVTGRVAFDDVSFRYEADEPLIEHLALAVEPGQSVAIVGPTGAGKTTLVNLLMRFYDVDEGRITLDGVDISSVPRDELRRHIGMVLQDTWLFGGTIADNIAYGRPDASRADIVAAAQAVHADHLIRTLPDGYDTVLDDHGADLSAGERQLVTIARAFLVDPSLLILDEATSSVDTRTEMLIQHAMATLRSGRTSFIIAHRLSTIRDADVILVMEHGDIVEQGSHADLLAANGAYARLYAAQFTAAAAPT